ncbi:MAG: hypothetical protein PGN23_04000 [Sphingomonas adhaesiva]|uniref:hypothetical protein n=1 Tax=Sphingomonas adhaesiva TaxID=28212 RepID=UPI002FFB94DE
MLAAILLQAATAHAPPVPARFSILAPVANQPCTRQRADDEIVVCADPLPAQSLPLPDEAISPDAVPVNRSMTGTGALAAENTPCATVARGCQTGVDILGMGTVLIRGVQRLVAPGSCCEDPGEGTSTGRLVVDAGKGAAKLFRRRPDKGNRVAIPIDDPVMTGRVSP